MCFKKFPIAIYLIIALEFGGRFSFCGLRTLLSMYLRNALGFSEETSTILYHVFIMVCYIVPILGAIVADGWFGRFGSILIFSIICTAGYFVQFVASEVQNNSHIVSLTLIALTLIAFGTGGIKPCMAPFGGDQFLSRNLLQTFFSMFYFVSNLGGLLGMFAIPLIRKSVPCDGEDYCYPVAFATMAIAMVVALCVFLIGKPCYRIKAPKDNIITKFICCATYAVKRKIEARNAKKRHWLDYAEDKYEAGLMKDMKDFMDIFLLFVPLPIFWSLLAQQGSRWTFQATRMNGFIFGLQISPDQVQAINPAMVLMLIPLFNKCLFPRFENFTCLGSPLRRIHTGGIMAAFAFTCALMLEVNLQKTYPIEPSTQESHLILINTLPCDLHVELSNDEETISQSGKLLPLSFRNVIEQGMAEVRLTSHTKCGDSIMQEEHSIQKTILLKESETYSMIIATNTEGSLSSYMMEAEDISKTLSGRPKLRLIVIRTADIQVNDAAVTIYDENGISIYNYNVGRKRLAISNYTELRPGRYSYYVTMTKDDMQVNSEFEGFLIIEVGGVYSLVLREFGQEIVFAKNMIMTPPNYIHMVWMLPQYFFISVAEVLLVVSGLEFCFAQSPKSMKTVTMAAWYFSVACGNLLVIFVTQLTKHRDQVEEFFIYAVLILLDMVLFQWISANYRRKHFKNIDPSDQSDDENYPLLGKPSEQAIYP